MSFHHVQFFKSRSSTYSSKTFLIHCTDPVSISIWSKVTKLIQSTLILFGYSRKVQSCAPKIPNKIGAEKRKSWTHFVALVRHNDWLLRLFRFKIFSRSVLFLKYLNLRLRYKKVFWIQNSIPQEEFRNNCSSDSKETQFSKRKNRSIESLKNICLATVSI